MSSQRYSPELKDEAREIDEVNSTHDDQQVATFGSLCSNMYSVSAR